MIVRCLRIVSWRAASSNASSSVTVPSPSVPLTPTTKNLGAMAVLFDDSANWSLTELRPKKRPGRSWTADELRLKSNADLHRLWFVCLRERDMLRTMRAAYVKQSRHFPNPERLDRVAETMDAIKEVVDERDDAVLRLETGDGAAVPKRRVTFFTGFTQDVEVKEHLDKAEIKEVEVPMLDGDAYMMQKLWAEKEHMKALEREDDRRRASMQTERMRRFKRGGPRNFNRPEAM